MSITEQQKTDAEAEIREHQAEVDYDTKEYPVEVIVDKYKTGLDTDTNELFVPDYQREMAWSDAHQSKFIESVIVGLPIPYLFVADIHGEGESDGRLEIVDGSQRVRTLHRFLANELELSKLEKLKSLNGFRFSDLPLSRQRRFNRRTLRMIELTEKATEDIRRDIFERINSGSIELEDMEKRRGTRQGPMLSLVEECAQSELFNKLAKFTESQQNRRVREELVLRFFAYQDGLDGYQDQVGAFLDAYLSKMNDASPEKLKELKKLFNDMLAVVEKSFPNGGFAKSPRHTTTPRVRFDAIAVGTALALKENSQLKQADTSSWIDSSEFTELTTSGSSNVKSKVMKRIDYVKLKMLDNFCEL